MNKRYVSWDTIDHQVRKVITAFKNDNFEPDLIVGVVRGGAIPAVWMSNITGIESHMISVSFRDNKIQNPYLPVPFLKKIAKLGHQTLILDDINDSGETLVWIQNKIREYSIDVEKNQIRYACLMDNTPSMFKDLNYSAEKINKDIDPEWIVFPWEK